MVSGQGFIYVLDDLDSPSTHKKPDSTLPYLSPVVISWF